MKTQVWMSKWFIFIFASVLLSLSVQGISYGVPGGVCQVGDVLSPGQSCTYPGTSTKFFVLNDGTARFGFFSFGGGTMDARGVTFNGVTYSLLASKLANGNWKLHVVADQTTPPPLLTNPEVLVVDPDAPPIYWTDQSANKIQGVQLDGSNVEDLVTSGLTAPYGIALDIAGGKMYWLDWSTEKIQRSNLDGSNVEDLVTSGLTIPLGIALDVAGGRMYWTDQGTDKIQRSNLDGSNVEDLVTSGLTAPESITLDIADGKMYWTDWWTDKIQRSNLDGTNVEDLVTSGLTTPVGITLDIADGKMYWTDLGSDKIQRSNLDGTNVEDLVTTGNDNAFGIALDVAGGKMYWTQAEWNSDTETYTNGKIKRANLDGSNVEDVITGLGLPPGIVLGTPPNLVAEAAEAVPATMSPGETFITEATLNGSVVTLTLKKHVYETDISKIREALTVTGIHGLTVDPVTVQRISDTKINVALTFDGTDFDADAALTFNVASGAIVNYTGDAFTTGIPVTAIEESVSASVESPLTEATLEESVVTLSLIGLIYEADVANIGEALTVTGLNGVTVDPDTVQRISNTEITVLLNFDGTDFDVDTALTFNVASGAIVNYTGDAFTTGIPVTAIEESVSASVESPLTEATLAESVVSLTLTGLIYEADVAKIREVLTVTGITGVTVNPDTVQRISDTEITVALTFDGTDFDADMALTFSVTSGAIADYTGDEFTADVPVTAIEESVSASVEAPLTEATLEESVVTLTLTGLIYESDISKIRDAVSVSGIDGVTIAAESVQRVSETEIKVELDFDWTNFDTDTALTFSVASGAIADYTGDDFTTEVPVTAIQGRVEISVSTSVVSQLTEASLNENVVTLVLAGAAYEQEIGKIKDAVTVSGIDGVTIASSKIQRLSDRKATVELSFDGTDFDENGTLTFNVAAGAIANYTGDAFTVELAVTAHKESVSASVVSPLTEATLNGSTVALTLTAATYEQNISKIKDAVTVSGITGVKINSSEIQRLSDREITVELSFDGTDFVRDLALIFSVDAGAITDHKGSTLTTETLVTANRDEILLKMYWTDSSTEKIRRANLDGSDVEDLVTTGLRYPGGIALDVVGGKMYWTDWKIRRANLDGSNVEDLVTTGLNSPSGIALDVVGGKMYWTDWGTDKIRRANLDGSNVEDLVTTGLRYPVDIALDVVGGKMYWTDSRTDKIQRANLDGSNVEDLVTTGLDIPGGIALDVVGGKMYWTDSGTDKIRRANLDGSNVEDLVTLRRGWNNPVRITLDVVSGKMYWTDNNIDKIQRANLDGSNIEDLVTYTQGLRNPRGIAIGLATPVNSTTVKEDVNRDGVVDVQDLAVVGLRYGKTGENDADINGDGVVNVDDLILVAAAIDAAAAAAPAADAKVKSHFTETQLQGWLTEARASGNTSRTYQRGITVLEQLLALFTPEKTALLANYPNPFNPETWIPYQLEKTADVSLTIYDIRGVVVRELKLGHQHAGLYQSRSRAAYWDGRNAFGEKVASGLYFYTLTAGEFTATRKMLIRK